MTKVPSPHLGTFLYPKQLNQLTADSTKFKCQISPTF